MCNISICIGIVYTNIIYTSVLYINQKYLFIYFSKDMRLIKNLKYFDIIMTIENVLKIK